MKRKVSKRLLVHDSKGKKKMKKLVVSCHVLRSICAGGWLFAVGVAMATGARAAVLDKTYLSADRPAVGETTISESEALVFRPGGRTWSAWRISCCSPRPLSCGKAARASWTIYCRISVK